MDTLTSASVERIGVAPSSRRYERHRSASKLQPQTDPLIRCVELDYLEELDDILKENGKHYTQRHLDEALQRAAQLGKSRACVALINAGSDVNALEAEDNYEKRFDNTCSVFSPEQAQYESWLKLHSAVCGTALHIAVENERVETVHILLESGACVNMTDKNGVTPLMLACMRRGNKMVRLLVNEKGCNVDMREKQFGRTGLHFAAENGDANTLQILLQSGAKAECYDHRHNSPLILCCTPPAYTNPSWPPQQSLACVQMLLEHGAFVNGFNDDGQSALQLAVLSRLLETAAFLLQRSALLQPEVLRSACLEMRDADMIALLLAESNSFQDEYLCAILLVVISTEASKWSLNARMQEENNHQIARILIKHISDPDAYVVVGKMDVAAMAVEFGDDFLGAFTESDRQDLQSYGFLGYALLKGKYSIAHMLYVAGCRDKLTRMSGNTRVVHLADTHAYLRPWLSPALERAATLQNTTPPQFFYDAIALDSIEAYDENIHSSVHGMIDRSYARREDSKASSARSVLLYYS